VDSAYVLANGEEVLWEGRPRQRRVFAVQDIFLVPFSLLWATAAVVGSFIIPDVPWTANIVFLAAAAYLTVGRFFYKWFVKSQTTYLVSNVRALVLRNGEIYEHQDLAGVKPEIAGWRRNRIVTFGDALESELRSRSHVLWTPVDNVGVRPGRFNVRRGDDSGYPIRFYDLGLTQAERLMSILGSSSFRRNLGSDDKGRRSVDHASPDNEPLLDSPAASRGDTVLDPVAQTTSPESTEGASRIGRWAAASPWRFAGLPALVAIGADQLFSALTHSGSRGLLPGIMVGGSLYLVYRRNHRNDPE